MSCNVCKPMPPRPNHGSSAQCSDDARDSCINKARRIAAAAVRAEAARERLEDARDPVRGNSFVGLLTGVVATELEAIAVALETGRPKAP